MRCSVVILACDKAAYTRRTLAGLLAAGASGLEFVLVDNGSADDTPEVFDDFCRAAGAAGAETKRLRFAENIGAVAGRNAALAECAGTNIVFMDNDVVPGRRSWLSRLETVLASDPGAGIVAPRMVFAAPPHAIQCAGCDIAPGGRVVFRGRGEPFDAPAFMERRDCPALISATWLMRREVRRAVGELDMLFHPVQFEDIDYCYRARQAGWRCVYEPSVWMYHFENVTTAGGRVTGNYRRLTLAHGLKFKRKWAEQAARDANPAADVPWRDDLPPIAYDDAGELPLAD